MTPTDRIIALFTERVEAWRPVLDGTATTADALSQIRLHAMFQYDERGYPIGVAMQLEEMPPRRERRRLGA